MGNCHRVGWNLDCTGGKRSLDGGFQPTCDLVNFFAPEYDCCTVNGSNFICPPGLDCTVDGCCEKDDPTVCYAHVPLEEAVQSLKDSKK